MARTTVTVLCAWAAYLLLAQVGAAMEHRLRYSCGSGQPAPIMGMTVVEGSHSNTACPDGFTKNAQDLNQGAGGDYEYLCTSKGDAGYGSPITDIMVVTSNSYHVSCPSGYTRVRQDLNHLAGGDYVFFCYTRGGRQAVTDIYFLNSASSSCRSGYTHLSTNLNSGTGSSTVITTCVQKGCDVTLQGAEQDLLFRQDSSGNSLFKILHFTDTHFGETSSGDVETQFTVQWPVLLAEDPDLIVITGDAVSGYSWDGESGWFADVYAGVVDPMIALGYRWAYANGNHDPQADLTKTEIVDVDMALGVLGGNLSYTQQGPANITGATNYVLPLYGSTSKTVPAFNVWAFDSGMEDCLGEQGWGCVYPDQVQWYRDTSQAMAKAGTQADGFAFFHIPLQEFMQASYTNANCVGRKDEAISCSSVNTGLFDAALSMGDIKGFFCGHDHDNDYMFQHEGIWLSYGRKTGYGGYGPPAGWLRGARILLLREEKGAVTFDTWIRQQDQTEFDETACDKWSTQSICAGAAGASDQSRCTRYEKRYREMLHDGEEPFDLPFQQVHDAIGEDVMV